jgi:hypothetical protein
MTFNSADLIEALRRRRRKSLRPERPAGEFPPGWAAWFASMHARVGAITGATAEAIVAIFLAREPALPPRATLALNRWQSFTTLWRQQWHPASKDGRGVRIIASVVTLLVHLLLAIFLLYLAYVRFMAMTEPASAGEDVIQVEYIGEGTPDEEGGGPPQGDAVADDTAPAAAAQPAPRAEQQVAQPPPPSQAPPVATVETPVPPQPAPTPPLEQPLQATETPQPDQAFTVPPVRVAEVPQPRLPVPDLSVPAPEIRVVDVPEPAAPIQPINPAVATPAIAAPQLQQRPAEVAVRDIPAPLSPVRVRELPTQPMSAPELNARAPTVAARSIPTPPGATARAPSNAEATNTQPSTSTSVPATTPAPAGGVESATSGTRPATAATGGGATASPRPGALPSPKRGDDWGASDRNQAGGQAGTPGLFNADGTPKLASGDGKVGGGLPPGTITEDFAKIDRNGTWLKRPPTDYTPTSFDKFWVPNETLLQEWVRRSIKEVLIPIPGTSKKIKCSVVLLALGGACDITDPNMQDIEAGARKPPDVPFKPELQENQEALGKPPGTPPGTP